LRPPSATIFSMSGDAVLTAIEIALGWWCYYTLAGGSRRLDDPRSATLYLLLMPGLITGLLAGVHALTVDGPIPAENLTADAISMWIGRALGLIALVPPLLVIATPWLVHYGLAVADPSEHTFLLHPR